MNNLFAKSLTDTAPTLETQALNPKVISLFAGCGGLDLGFHQAGFEIVYANDIEKSVQATYERNLGSIDICDIRDVNKAQLPNADVILAGIPCQPFSNAGNRGSTSDDRGTLFSEVMEIVKLKKPRVVLFENVRGFISAKDENGISMPERIQQELNQLGYNLHYKLLNASDYGVPQNRYRVILLGVRSDMNKSYVFPDALDDKTHLTVGAILNKPLPKDEEQEVWNLSPQAMNMARHIPEGGSWKSVPNSELTPRFLRIKQQMKKYRSPNFYRRFSREEIMGTITAASTPENSGIMHPLEDRRYSVREIARFQSFPDDFKFVGASIPQKYKMIGNAVPVELSKFIANSIKEQLFS